MSNTEASQLLASLIAEEWDYRMRENPLMATSCGDHRFNDRMPAIEEADFARRAGQARDFNQRLQAIDRLALSPADQLNYTLFERELWMQLEEYRFGLHLMPVSRLSGFQVFLPDLALVTPFENPNDYENFLLRLQGFRAFFDGQIELMRLGLRRGFCPPSAALNGIEDTVSGHIVDDPACSVFYAPFEKLPERAPTVERARLQERARRTIQQFVLPAYRALAGFLADEYLPAARHSIAASELPDGAAYYAYSVKRYTTLDVTPQQVHEIGLQEVRRIRAEMDAIIRQVGFQGSFHDFLAFLRSAPQFFVETPEALLKHVAWIMKRMDGELPRLFGKLPRTPYGMREIPAYLAPNSTTAYYFPAPGDGSKAGYYYVNTYDLKSRPLYEYEALGFHEAAPGHHLQLALQMEMESVPDFRRFADVTSFVEGWALYAERLGLEVGFYQDPYSNFGRLTFEIWRACRLVVDTGMHALGWSRQQAIDYMQENTSLAALNIANEVDRYIAWPGQALAYKMGEIKISQLRRRAEQALGSAFDVRSFHDCLLQNGAISLDALDVQVEEWIAKRRLS